MNYNYGGSDGTNDKGDENNIKLGYDDVEIVKGYRSLEDMLGKYCTWKALTSRIHAG